MKKIKNPLKMKHTVALGALLSANLLVTSFGHAETKKQEALTMKQAVESAYNQSFLIPAEYDVKSSVESVTAAKRDWFPKASLQTHYDTNFISAKSNGGLSRAGTRVDNKSNVQVNDATTTLSVSQNLYAGGKTTAAIRAQEEAVKISMADYSSAENDLVLATIKVYSELVKKKSVYDVRTSNVSVLAKALSVAKTRFELGELTISGVAQTEAQLAEAQSKLTLAKAEYENSKAAFEKITGLKAIYKLESPSLPSYLPKTREEVVESALKKSSSLKKADADAARYKETVTQARADLLPSLDVSAGASRKITSTRDKFAHYNDYGKTFRSNFEARATLTIPLDFRGATQAGVRKQKYDAAKKRVEAINARRSVVESSKQKWETYVAKKEAVGQIKSRVNYAKTAYESTKAEFSAGSKTTLELLYTEQQYFDAQIDLVAAEQDYIQASYEVLRAMSVLNVNTLDLPLKRFTAQSYEESKPNWGLSIQK